MVEVIKFGAEWCGPCKMMKPTIQKLEEKYNVEGSNIKVTSIDVDEDKRLAAKYGVRNIPTIIFVKEDNEIEGTRKVGLRSMDEIESVLETLKN